MTKWRTLPKVPDCPPILLTIDHVDTICLDAMTDPVQLVTRLGSTVPVNQTEYFGNGVSLSGLFNPQQAGPGAHPITAIYTNGLCSKSIDIVIHVIEIPTGDFTAPTTVYKAAHHGRIGGHCASKSLLQLELRWWRSHARHGRRAAHGHLGHTRPEVHHTLPWKTSRVACRRFMQKW